MLKSAGFQQILVVQLQEDEVGHLIYTKYKSHLKIDSRTKCKNENYKTIKLLEGMNESCSVISLCDPMDCSPP